MKIKINFTYYFFQTKMKKCPYCSNTYKRLNSHIGSCFQRRVMMEKQIIELQQKLEQEKIKNQSQDKVQNVYNECTFTRNSTSTITVNATHTYIKDLQKNILEFGSAAREGIESVAHNYRGIIGARQLIKDMEKDAENGSKENKNILNILQTNSCDPPEDADKEVLDESLPLITKEIDEINDEITESIVKNVPMSEKEQEQFLKENQKGVFKNN